jgi:hypothetical protein
MTRGPNGSHRMVKQGRSYIGSARDQPEADSGRDPSLTCDDRPDVVSKPNSQFRLASGVRFGAKVELGCPQYERSKQ